MNFTKNSFQKMISQIPPLNLKSDDDDDDVSSIGFIEVPVNSTQNSSFSLGTPSKIKGSEKLHNKNIQGVNFSDVNKKKNSNNVNNNSNINNINNLSNITSNVNDNSKNKFENTQTNIQTSNIKYNNGANSDTLPDEMSDEIRDMFMGFNQVPYNKIEMKKILDKEDLERKNKRMKLLNTVITDQLWRPVLSDPSQTRIMKSSSSSSQPSSSSSLVHQPGDKRGAHRHLHDTLITTSSSATESSLNNVVVFEARIMTPINKEALKDITGFYFAVDRSITIYEYKLFGSETKALPLIKRNTYIHLHGPRSGEPYQLPEIIQGNDLEFPTSNQPLPDVWKSQNCININILSVDVDAKKKILLKDVDKYQHENVWNKLHLPKNDIEERHIRVPYQVQEITRSQLSKKRLTTYFDLGCHYRKLCRDERSLEQLNTYELERGLNQFGISLSENKLSSILEILDPENSSFVKYHKFMRAILGEMDAERKMLVLKAFTKLDSTRSGIITTSLIHKFLNAPKHIKVKNKEKQEGEIKETFINAFSAGSTQKNSITFKEFEELFEGLSICVESDEDFFNILKNMWNI